jgi:hypothetical protein
MESTPPVIEPYPYVPAIAVDKLVTVVSPPDIVPLDVKLVTVVASPVIAPLIFKLLPMLKFPVVPQALLLDV